MESSAKTFSRMEHDMSQLFKAKSNWDRGFWHGCLMGTLGEMFQMDLIDLDTYSGLSDALRYECNNSEVHGMRV